jgi:hypothetical protein
VHTLSRAALAMLAVLGMSAAHAVVVTTRVHVQHVQSTVFVSANSGLVTGGVQIRGNVTLVGVANGVTTVASGTNNRAVTSVGVIHRGTAINGNTSVIGVARDVATVAVGSGNIACTEIGTIGDSLACQL